MRGKRLHRSTRWLFLMLLGPIMALSLAGCVRDRSYAGRGQPSDALASFDLVFHDAITNHIEPVAPSKLLHRALDGVRTVPAFAQASSQAIIAEATARADNLQVEAEAPYLDVFKKTIDTLIDVPQPPSRATVVKAALSGMLDGLDPATGFQPLGSPSGFGLVSPARELGAVGLRVTRLGGQLRVVTVFPNMLGRQSGVYVGDILQAIDGQPVDTIDLNSTIKRLQGPIRSHVKVTVDRGVPPVVLTLDIERRLVAVQPLVVTRFGDLLYIRVEEEVAGSTEALRRNLVNAWMAGPVHGTIVDLRGNTGGRLDEVVGIARLMLTRDTPIVTIEARRSADVERFSARQDALLGAMPTIVLVDRQTANGAEILASALQNGRHALLMGDHTAGAGLVATARPLPGLGIVRLATGHTILASGVALGTGGLMPDLPTLATPGASQPQVPPGDPMLDAALQELRRRIAAAAADPAGTPTAQSPQTSSSLAK